MKSVTLKAEEILHEFRNSSSLPVLVTAGNDSYVIKWKGSGDGHIANIIDWIALHLAGLVGINTPQPVLINVGSDLRDKTDDAEIRDLIDFSQGLNLGLGFLTDAVFYNQDIHGRSEPSYKNRIFFYDLLMLNIDRIDINPNMLVVENQIYCIDFSASMALRSCITGISYNEETLLQRLKRHPFYSLSPCTKLKPDNKFYLHLRNVIEGIPTEWLQCESSESLKLKQKIFENITNLFENIPAIIERRLEIMAKLPTKTREEERCRSMRNRKLAERRFSRL
ncbi:hypothetical protein QUF72_05300 [Desulfobacterales bacterium HSG2]|nr:hypothetical protein [Desulfobacterales bacterium HSG2]